MTPPARPVRTTFSRPSPDAPGVTFGDLIELPWLGDLHLRPSSERLIAVTMKGGRAGFRPAEQHEQSAEWIGYSARPTSAQRPICAVIVSDECQVEDVLNGRPAQDAGPPMPPGGRLLMAPLRPAQPEEMAVDAYGRAPVGPAGQWPVPASGFDHGGLIDFDQTFNVKLGETEAAALAAARIAIPDDPDVLLRRWSAYAVRRGPLVAQTAAVQTRELLTGQAAAGLDDPDDSAPPALYELLGLLWAAEGQISDRVSATVEIIRRADNPDAARPPEADALRADLLRAIKRIAAAADDATAELANLGIEPAG